MHNGTSQNGTLHNGMFLNSKLHNGTLQNGIVLPNITITKWYTVIKRYMSLSGTLQNGTQTL
jgi:hypothetical protein